MNLEQLKQLFFEAFQNPVIKKPVHRPPHKPIINHSSKHLLYPINALQELIGVLKGLDPYDDYDERFSARYIVLEDGQLLLAREGSPCRTIPAHREMGSHCIAAGNIYFSTDYQLITKINHQSGDFHSTQGSMVWPLAIILLSNAAISPSFTIDISNVNSNGKFTIESLDNLSSENLINLLPVGIMDVVGPANVEELIVVKARNYQGNMTLFSKPVTSLLLPAAVSAPFSYATPPTTPRG